MGIFKRTTNTVELTCEGHNVRVINWWKIAPLKSELSLYVDGQLVGKDTRVTHINPVKPILSVEDVSEAIQSLEVYFAGVMSAKLAVKINGETVYCDPLDWFDQQHVRLFEDESVTG